MFSMTGFGEARTQIQRPNGQEVELSVEIKSVNHRYLDISARLPGMYSRYENEIQKLIREKLRRGRVELFLTRKEAGTLPSTVRFSEETFEAYLAAVKAAFSKAGLASEKSLKEIVLQLLDKREVLDTVVMETEATDDSATVLEVVSRALDGLARMREQEGAALTKEIEVHLLRLETLAKEVEAYAEIVPGEYRAKLQLRLEKLTAGIEIDPQRIAQEVAVLSDRSDIREELARLESHYEQARGVLTQREGGRKFEFLLQEMGREWNTIGSKSQHAEISSRVIEAKLSLEKIREQVQNIE